MSERGLTADVKTESQKDVISSFYLIEASYPSGTIRACSMPYDIIHDGQTWQGLGSTLAISPITETVDSRAQRVKLTMSGIDNTFLDPALNDEYQGVSVKIYLGYISQDSGNVVGTYAIFGGVISEDTIDCSEDTFTVTYTCVSELDDHLRKREMRYTDQDQQTLHPGDKGLEYIAEIQDLTFTWGAPES